jgi:hypothetical protein
MQSENIRKYGEPRLYDTDYKRDLWRILGSNNLLKNENIFDKLSINHIISQKFFIQKLDKVRLKFFFRLILRSITIMLSHIFKTLLTSSSLLKSKIITLIVIFDSYFKSSCHINLLRGVKLSILL